MRAVDTNVLLRLITCKAGHLPLGTFDRELSKLEDVERL